MDEALIEKIVLKVLAELKGFDLKNMTLQVPQTRQRMLVLSENETSLPNIFLNLCSQYKDFEITILKTHSGLASTISLPQQMDWVEIEDVKRNKWDQVYLHGCTVNTLVKVALGLREGITSELIGIALAKGTPIDMETPSFDFTPQTNLHYRQLLEGYLQQITSYGIRLNTPLNNKKLTDKAAELPISTGSEALTVNNHKRTHNAPSQSDIIHYEKKLLTERDVNKLPADSLVVVKKNYVITPLARDVLKVRNIKLQVEGEDSLCF